LFLEHEHEIVIILLFVLVVVLVLVLGSLSKHPRQELSLLEDELEYEEDYEIVVIPTIVLVVVHVLVVGSLPSNILTNFRFSRTSSSTRTITIMRSNLYQFIYPQDIKAYIM
jgi:hypothetical protein